MGYMYQITHYTASDYANKNKYIEFQLQTQN